MKNGICLNCNKQFRYREQCQLGKYCSNKCQKEKEYKEKITNWLKNNVAPGLNAQRKFLRENQQNKCCICNLTEWCNKPITLEMDHINGNATDNTITNLRMLCPNCHSQTPTFKNKNRGKGRTSRRK